MTHTIINLIKGDNNMKKKAMFVVAVAAVLVLAFSAVAMAKYAGAFDVGSTPAAGTNSTAGYLSWSGAKDIANDDNLGLQTALGETTTAHGGYTIATVKCAVCHSAHRAYASGETSTAPTAAGAPQGLGYVTSQYTTVDNHLTYGNACVNCHTVWGGGGATKKIEWAQTGSGPHNGQNCVSECHTGGIHGDKPSAYYGMNAFMLGDEKDTVITTALSKGNVSANLSYTAAGTQTGNAAWFQNGNEGGTPGSGA
ncbi:MAG: hypothetical protein LBS17_02040, partial [Actinomycetes bacterium]|nr:hypothetical protein [Actinomycetes bacterium]